MAAYAGWMTYGHLRADCLYTGISYGPNARYQVWESLYLYLYYNQAQSKYKHVLADISRSPLCCYVHRLSIHPALCCHSNETGAPIANAPNSA